MAMPRCRHGSTAARAAAATAETAVSARTTRHAPDPCRLHADAADDGRWGGPGRSNTGSVSRPTPQPLATATATRHLVAFAARPLRHLLSLSLCERRRASDNLNELRGDGSLAGAVVLQRQRGQHLAGALRRVLHRTHTGCRLRAVILKHSVVQCRCQLKLCEIPERVRPLVCRLDLVRIKAVARRLVQLLLHRLWCHDGRNGGLERDGRAELVVKHTDRLRVVLQQLLRDQRSLAERDLDFVRLSEADLVLLRLDAGQLAPALVSHGKEHLLPPSLLSGAQVEHLAGVLGNGRVQSTTKTLVG
mmetsp:Transcript_8989/g.27286  ORF Transcript_8989/g.27286 Transcript_8989/m.27286 type:complete len:304 (+) Transcript_8989:262-1173(+)